MSIASFIISQDFVGKGMNFKITANGNHQTFYGGFLSIIYYLLFFYFVFNFGYIMFITRKPSGYSQIKPGMKDKSEYLNFTENKFIFGFRIEDSDGVTVNTKGILFPIFSHIYRNKYNGLVEITRLKTVNCHNVIPENVDTKSYEVEEFYCPDLSKIPHKTLRGSHSDEESSMIEFSYSICNHDPDDLKCNDPKRLRDLFVKKTLWATAIFPYVKYMIDNSGNPLVVELVERYDVLSPYKLTYDEFQLNEYMSTSDYGILGTSNHDDRAIGISSSHSFGKITKDLPEVNNIQKKHRPEDTSIFLGTILYERNLYFYSRSYKKIQDFLGSIVGVMKLVGFGIAFASDSFSKLKLKEFLISQLLVFEIENEEAKKSKKDLERKITKYFHGQKNNNADNSDSYRGNN